MMKSLMIDVEWLKLGLYVLKIHDDAETLLMDKHDYVTELGKTKSYKNIQGQYTGLIKIRAIGFKH